RPEQRVLFEEGQQHDGPARVVLEGPRRVLQLHVARGEAAKGVVVAVAGDANLLEIVEALDAGRRLADFLHRRQEQADEDGDDGDDDEQLDQRERAAWPQAGGRREPEHGQTSLRQERTRTMKKYAAQGEQRLPQPGESAASRLRYPDIGIN